MPLPGLLYAQVIKTVHRRRLVRLSHRVVFSARERVTQVLAACGCKINTAFNDHRAGERVRCAYGQSKRPKPGPGNSM